MDNEDCVWATSSRGGLRLTEGGLCCSHKRCSETYMASEGDKGAQVTGKLRRYYHSLTRAGKRSFQAARISMHVPARQLGADLHADLHGKQVYTYTLEAFPVLRAGLPACAGWASRVSVPAVLCLRHRRPQRHNVPASVTG